MRLFVSLVALIYPNSQKLKSRIGHSQLDWLLSWGRESTILVNWYVILLYLTFISVGRINSLTRQFCDLVINKSVYL